MKMQQAGVAAVLTGLVLVVAALVWPNVDDPSDQWTDQDAEAYEETVARVHEGAHLEARARGPARMHGSEPVDPERLAQHRRDVEALAELTTRLDNARERPLRIAGILKWSGAGLVAIGVVTLFAARSRGE